MPLSKVLFSPRRNARKRVAAVLVGLAALAVPVLAVDTDAPPPPAGSQVEEIYVLRSMRETRNTPTAFCAKEHTTLETPAFEDNYLFLNVAIDGSGRVTDPGVQTAGSIHGCFGRTADAGLFLFYGEFAINGIMGKAFGDCRSGKIDYPEKGLRLFSCYFDLTGLPPEYVGGQLTTNSLNSAKITGMDSDPAGYTQVSIATVRLWKKRAP